MSKAKQSGILSYVESHANEEIATSALAAATQVSLPTVLTFIKNNPQYFTKVKHGTYRINAVNATTTTVTTASVATTATTAPTATAVGGHDAEDTTVARPYEW